MARRRWEPLHRSLCAVSLDDPVVARAGWAGRRLGSPAEPDVPRLSTGPWRGGRGLVYLVGAGPGDPELLTLRAVALMREAEVVVHDYLVSDEVLGFVNPRAERIYAGKRQGCHALSQDEINKLLVALARRGKRVVRLKGGDPFIFGRGGEEAEFCARHGVRFEVVPGVTSASGAAAYSGIPLTHRETSRAVVFVTGHLKDGTCDLDWPMLARPRQTVVIYMGITRVAEICRELVAHGLDPSTPAAAIERATTPEQRVVAATVGTLAAATAGARVKPPALIVVGEVVSLRDRLDSQVASIAGLERAAAAS
jgi:uroporphyrin-III C-methyltransferase/precorrin-2 dehydrogenase/sirohydrochlorin ferrochelatase